MDEIGALVSLKDLPSLKTQFARMCAMDLPVCQLNCWDLETFRDMELAGRIRRLAADEGIRITAFWAGWSGPKVWDLVQGPHTLGLVPEEYREMRLQELMAASRFCEQLGVSDMITHVGFLPEVPDNPNYRATVAALRRLAEEMLRRSQFFLFETGQETPVTVLRAIEDIGTGNLGINLDTANLILYGKGNPVDAIDVFGRHVRNTHCKDGLFPTDPYKLGHEVAFGEGKADFPQVIAKLHALGYHGPWIIEREISGEEQERDIVKARDGLKRILFAERAVAAG